MYYNSCRKMGVKSRVLQNGKKFHMSKSGKIVVKINYKKKLIKNFIKLLFPIAKLAYLENLRIKSYDQTYNQKVE